MVEEAAGRGDEKGDSFAEAGLFGGAGLAACVCFSVVVFCVWRRRKAKEKRERA